MHGILVTPHSHLSTYYPLKSMDQEDIQKRVEAFLKDLGVPSFIVFGWQKGDPASGTGHVEFGIVSSQHNVPANAAIKGMSWALQDLVNKSL